MADKGGARTDMLRFVTAGESHGQALIAGCGLYLQPALKNDNYA